VCVRLIVDSPQFIAGGVTGAWLRLIALVQYLDGILMIRFFGSHEEYDSIVAETV
jgi:mRNA-degrading endonuclease HigB of HigAB toxin-antitoxin module